MDNTARAAVRPLRDDTFLIGILAGIGVLLVLALLACPLSLSAQTVTDAEAREFQRIITSQLNAFNADDGAGGE